MVHEWWGLNDYVRNVARRLAEAGYVGFALDMYGNGKMTAHPDSAQAFMNEAMANMQELAARFTAARDELVKQPQVDSRKNRRHRILFRWGGGARRGRRGPISTRW